MAFRTSFSTDNAAFSDGDAASETARILRNIADRLERGDLDGCVFDASGNRVGTFDFDPPEADEDGEEER